jgi:hypothetical protein
MDHAEVLERIEEAVAAPGGLGRFGADQSPDAIAVREHVAACPACAAEWRAWSVVSMGLAAAAPDTLVPRPELRDQVIAMAATRPRVGSQAPVGMPAAAVPTSDPSSPMTPLRSGIALGPRRARNATAPAAATASSAPPFRWLLAGAAIAVVLFMAGAVLGGRLAPAAPTPTQGTAVASPTVTRGDPGRVLAEAALILQSADHRLAALQTPEGDAGGVVVVSPGSDRLAVVSSVLQEPPDDARYVCLVDRDGERTQVGYMRWEPTADGGGLAYWAGDATPDDLGQAGDIFIVQLDIPDAQPALTGEFAG